MPLVAKTDFLYSGKAIRGPQTGLRSEATEPFGEKRARCVTRSRHRRCMRRVNQRAQHGEMAERSKATVLKTVRGASSSGVRIPLSPPNYMRENRSEAKAKRARARLCRSEGLRDGNKELISARGEVFPCARTSAANSPIKKV